jgi:hypothetical protein
LCGIEQVDRRDDARDTALVVLCRGDYPCRPGLRLCGLEDKVRYASLGLGSAVVLRLILHHGFAAKLHQPFAAKVHQASRDG